MFPLRTMVYDPSPTATMGDISVQDCMNDPQNPGVLVEDRNDDGIAEWIHAGSKTKSGHFVDVLNDTEFSGHIEDVDSIDKYVPGDVMAATKVDPKWKKSYLARNDLGLTEMFPETTGCEGDELDLEGCPLLRRFASMIDRHEDFYQTYSSLEPNSIYLAAAGFIFLMRIPFDQILTGDARSIDTLGRLKGDLKSCPEVLRLHDISAGTKNLDMSKVWLDIASLSHNQDEEEHEISKFGAVAAEQIEGIFAIERPAALGGTPHN